MFKQLQYFILKRSDTLNGDNKGSGVHGLSFVYWWFYARVSVICDSTETLRWPEEGLSTIGLPRNRYFVGFF